MKDIEGKKAQLGDNTVDCAIGKIPGILEPPDETAQFLPGNLFRGFVEEDFMYLGLAAWYNYRKEG